MLIKLVIVNKDNRREMMPKIKKRGERDRTQIFLTRIGTATRGGLDKSGLGNLISAIKSACEFGETSWTKLGTTEANLHQEIPLLKDKKWPH